MKVIVAGSRDIFNYEIVKEAIQCSGFNPTTIISGNASGIDKLGEQYAKEHNLTLDVYSADWQLFGKSAGPIRNKEMAANADALIAIWDGLSRGTKNMIEVAISYGLKVKVFLIVEDEIAEVRDFSPQFDLISKSVLHDLDVKYAAKNAAKETSESFRGSFH